MCAPGRWSQPAARRGRPRTCGASCTRSPAQYPEGPVHIIWDNLNIHRDGATQRWSRFTRRYGGRFVFHYTPKPASWVNQIEHFFSIVHRQCLRHGDFHSVAELRAVVLGFIAAWNSRRAHPFRWTGYPLQAEETLAP
jgi:transposase